MSLRFLPLLAIAASMSLACGSVVYRQSNDAGADAAAPDVPPPLVRADKVDLLLMIDNSASMGEKQAILADAVPNLLAALIQPKCVDPNGAQVGQQQRGSERQQEQQLQLPERQ